MSDQLLGEGFGPILYQRYLFHPASSHNLNVDGSITPLLFQTFDFNEDQAQRFMLHVTEVSLIIADGAGMGDAEFANLGVALTNGLTFGVYSGGSLTARRLNHTPITRNEHILAWFGSGPRQALMTATDPTVLCYTWQVPDHVPPFAVDLSASEAFGVLVQDNLSAVNHLRCMVRGWAQTIHFAS